MIYTFDEWLLAALRLLLICQYHGIPLHKSVWETRLAHLPGTCADETRRTPGCFGIAVDTFVDVPRTL
jgi:hypothetical protein